MGQVASRPQTHVDPVHSVSMGRGRRTEQQVLETALGGTLLLYLDPLLPLQCGLHLSLFFSRGNTAFKAISFKRDECSGRDIIASVLLPPATRQLLTK